MAHNIFNMCIFFLLRNSESGISSQVAPIDRTTESTARVGHASYINALWDITPIICDCRLNLSKDILKYIFTVVPHDLWYFFGDYSVYLPHSNVLYSFGGWNGMNLRHSTWIFVAHIIIACCVLLQERNT